MSTICIHCPKCAKPFDHNTAPRGRTAGTLAGLVAGAALGARIGIVAGPWGAIAGTVPGAVLGALGVGNVGRRLVDDPRCPHCGCKFSLHTTLKPPSN